MTKQDFLSQLRRGLAALPPEEREERLLFYAESIDDRMEDGLSEEEAVAAMGSADEILSSRASEPSLPRPTEESPRSKRPRKAWEITLLIVGSPLWLSLGIAAVAVVFSLYAILWALILSLWAVFGAFVGTSLGSLASGILLAANGVLPSGLVLLAVALICASLSLFLFYGVKAASKGAVRLSLLLIHPIKNRPWKKEKQA